MYIYIHMFACTVYVSFPKSVHPKSDGLPLSIMSKKTLLCWQYINRYGPFYPKPITQAEIHFCIISMYIYIYTYGFCIYIYIYSSYTMYISKQLNNTTVLNLSFQFLGLCGRAEIAHPHHPNDAPGWWWWTLLVYIWWIGSLSHYFHGKSINR